MGTNSLTYAQAKTKLGDAIAVGRNDDTIKDYNSVYENKILPLIGDIPLDELSEKLCQEAIDEIEKRGYIENDQRNSYQESTIQKYRFILYLVIREAAKANLCVDFLWGTVFSMSPERFEKLKERIREGYQGLIPKSLTVEEEKQIANILLADPMCDGEKVGLLLMFGLGLRNSEACGANYSDIVQICPSENLKALRVWETTEGNTNDLRTGGKTRNMPRLVPIPTRIADFLDKRLQALGADARDKEGQIPIACKGSCHDVRLTRDQLSAAARQLFREIEMKEGEVISLELDESIGKAWGEKEPTAYLFRRNFATHLFVLGLEIEEIEYLMGHKISGRYEVRSDFANPDLLLQIAKKMQYRPLINEVSDTVSICLDSGGECCGELPIGGQLEVTLPKGTSQISIISGEPGDKLDIHIHETKKLKMDARIHGEAFRPERVLNNLVSYRRRYEG